MDTGNRPVSNKPVEDVTGKVMVMGIIVLFFVVVFVFFLHLYAKWFLWRVDEATVQSTRRRRLEFAADQDPATGKGLDPSVLLSLPVLSFNREEFEEGLECAVCLSEVEDGEETRLLPECNHGFHVECIDMWFQSHSTCPLCRNQVSEQCEEISGTEALNSPTMGDSEQQVESNCPSSPTNTSSMPPYGMLIIDIPEHMTENLQSAPSSAVRFAEEELNSPLTRRLRLLKRFLSSSSCAEAEQVDRKEPELMT